MGNFNLLNLIIKNTDQEGAVVDKPTSSKKEVSFPKEDNGIFGKKQDTKTYTKTSTVLGTAANPSKYLNEIIEVYQRKFDALNKEGYDFHEFFEAMSDLSPRTAETYKMASHFATKIDKNVSKDYLLATAGYYEEELTKLHDFNESQGNQKLQEISNEKAVEKSSLEGEVQSLKNQIAALELQMSAKNSELKSIESKYASQISDIESKLAANTAAKNAVLGSIAEIKSGIEQHVN